MSMLNHEQALAAIYDAARLTVLSYQEAIEGYLKLRGESRTLEPGDPFIWQESDSSDRHGKVKEIDGDVVRVQMDDGIVMTVRRDLPTKCWMYLSD